MRVDFYQLSRDPVERVVAMLARKVLEAGERLLVVSSDADQRAELSKELWRAGPDVYPVFPQDVVSAFRRGLEELEADHS